MLAWHTFGWTTRRCSSGCSPIHDCCCLPLTRSSVTSSRWGWTRRPGRRGSPPGVQHHELARPTGDLRYPSQMLISVIGAGYVGLVTAACLAHLGSDVRVVDIDAARVERLRAGDVPIHEPGLDDAGRARASHRAGCRSTPSLPPRTARALVIVAVGTLDRAGEWTVELVERAVVGVARDPGAPRHLVIRSTLMPGTAARLAAMVQRPRPPDAGVLQPRVHARGQRRPRLPGAGPGGRRRGAGRGPARGASCMSCTRPWPSPSWTRTSRAPRPSSSPRTCSWRPRSASPTSSRACAPRRVRMCMPWWMAWASMRASGAPS